MMRVVDMVAYRPCLQLFGRVGPKQPADLFGLLEVGAEPEFVILRGEDGRHAVVERAEQLVGRHRQDRTGLPCRPRTCWPWLPEAGESERPPVAQAHVVGLPPAARALPDIKAVGQDQAAAQQEG